jgi:hypothetical protein
MPASGSSAYDVVLADPRVDGVILAPIEGGPWTAVQALRDAMVRLRELGLGARVAYVLALGRDGSLVSGGDPSAALFALAYRFDA